MAAKKDPVSFQSVATAAKSPAKPAEVAKTITAEPVVAVAPTIVAPAPVVAVAAPVTAAVAVKAPVAVKAEPARDRSSIIALIAKLSDADAEIARDAAVTLGTLPVDTEALTALCAVLRNADNFYHPVVRAAAATALGQFKDARAFDALLHATGDAMAEASEEAAKSLGLLKDVRAIATLERIIKNENHFYLETVQKAAEAALRNIRG